MFHDGHRNRELYVSTAVSLAVIFFVIAVTSAGLFDRFLIH